MKTAIPPNGVTARCVSRKIDRSADNRAVIWRGTGLSVAFDSTSLLSQILGPHLTPNFRFRDYCQSGYTIVPPEGSIPLHGAITGRQSHPFVLPITEGILRTSSSFNPSAHRPMERKPVGAVVGIQAYAGRVDAHLGCGKEDL